MNFILHTIAILAVTLLVAPLSAQDRTKGKGKEEDRPKPLPTDPDLLNLHRDFVKQAEKLAIKYEKAKDWSRAKDCYVEILKLVPQYPPARQKVHELMLMESTAQSQVVVLSANEKWKDTGVTVLEDRPISIRATGTWTFRLVGEVGPAGMKIPDELREFDPGCLVGMIVPVEATDVKDIKPFMIGAERQMIPTKTGKLFVQMYDSDVRDNEGEVTLEIRGTFQAAEFKPKKEKK